MICIGGNRYYPAHMIGRVVERYDKNTGREWFDVYGLDDTYLGQTTSDEAIYGDGPVLPHPANWKIYFWSYVEPTEKYPESFYMWECPVIGWRMSGNKPCPITMNWPDDSSEEDFLIRNTETDFCLLPSDRDFESFDKAAEYLVEYCRGMAKKSA